MAALTSSMPVVTLAALFLVVVSAMAVQTAATRPAADGYAGAAATTTDKPVEQSTGGGEATTASTNKPTEDGYAGAATTKPVEKTDGEATMPAATATAKPAEEGYAATTDKPVVPQTDNEIYNETDTIGKSTEEQYANAIKVTKNADQYAKQATTATSPEKATTIKNVADLLSSMAQTAVALGDKTAKETGVYYVTEKEVGDLTAGVKATMEHLDNIGERNSAAYNSLVAARALAEDADRNLKSATTVTSPKKIVGCKKSANDAFISALLHVAEARASGKEEPATVSSSVDVKPAAKQAMEAVTQPAGEGYAAPKEEAVNQPAGEAYAAKDAAPKEEAVNQPAGEAYAAKDASPKEEAVNQPATDAYAAKDAAPKEEASTKDAYTAGTA